MDSSDLLCLPTNCLLTTAPYSRPTTPLPAPSGLVLGCFLIIPCQLLIMKRRKSNLHHHRLKQHYSDLFIYLWDIAPGQLIAFPADGFSITLSIFNILSLWTLPYNTFLHYSFIVFSLNINPVFLSPAVHLLLLFWMSDREGSASQDETWREGSSWEKKTLSASEVFFIHNI